MGATHKNTLPYKHSEITEKIIAAFYTVYNALGYGFLEKVYENALLIELRKKNMAVTAQAPITVFYDGEVVGEYFADLKTHVKSGGSSNRISVHQRKSASHSRPRLRCESNS